MRNILITGASGQLGQALQARVRNNSRDHFLFATRKTLDFSRPEAISSFLENHPFDIIINCAAYTAVDQAEADSELADIINHQAVATLAQAAGENNSILIHISTDYVFSGESCRPYKETDAISPRSVYGMTKAKGEQAIQAAGTRGIIIRTSWLYSPFGNNFVKTMLRLGEHRDSLDVVFDQAGTPTCAFSLAEALLKIIDHPALPGLHGEIFHYSNEGVTSWYDFARTIMHCANLNCSIYPIETRDYPTPASRPHFSVLNKSAIKTQFAIQIPHWQDALAQFPLFSTDPR